MSPRVDICLVTWNGEAVLRGCLDSLERQTFTDTISQVADNGSTDASCSMVEDWISRRGGTMQRHEKNVGFALAYNQLIAQGTAEYVMVVNQDIDLAPDYLRLLVEALDAQPRAASASGLLMRMNLSSEGLGRTHIVDAAGLTLFPTHRIVERRRGEYQHRPTNAIEEVFGVPATAVLYRRRALEETVISRNSQKQYYDELFFSYKEDIDLAYRLQLAGWTSVVANEAVAYHVRGLRGDEVTNSYGSLQTVKERTQRTPEQRYLSYRNHLYFLFSDFFFPIWSRIWWWTVFYEAGKFFVVLVTEPRLLKAWSEVIQHLPVLRAKRHESKRRGVNLNNIQKWIA